MTSSNPISLMHIEHGSNTTSLTTNVQVSTSMSSTEHYSNNMIRKASASSSRSSRSSSIHDYPQQLYPNTHTQQHLLETKSGSSRSGSSSKVSELAHKVSDFLWATRRSIDTTLSNNEQNLHLTKGNFGHDTSPITSREGSHVSLTNLARGRPINTKRRSFLYRPNLSPSRDNVSHTTVNANLHLSTSNSSQLMSKNNTSSTSISSNYGVNNSQINSNKNSFCHFKCNDIDTPNTQGSSSTISQSKVKETHHVHVEYDPVTRKRVLNTYEILQDLGAGQHGKVKFAKDLSTGKKVAIKIVDRTGKPALMLNSLSRSGKGQSQEDKIRKEIAIMKKCDHPHVVKLIEVLDAEHSRKIYLVLEYLEKGEVKWQLSPKDVYEQLVKRGDISGDITEENENEIVDDLIPEPLMTLSQTKNIFRDVLSGLEYLHHQGIIHRDIKPSNLLVSDKKEVKISDFGVSFAANLEDKEQDDLELAKTAGTPAFLAPELCATDGISKKVTYKIDIWALGVTLYCLIFGRLPFHADSEYKLFECINNSMFSYPDMTRWRVAERIPESDMDIIKDLMPRLLDKNPETRIEIEEIKNHPFIKSDVISNDNYAGWNKDMKIDVSNEEVNRAVVGLGNRIKKTLSNALKKLKHDDLLPVDKDKTVLLPPPTNKTTVSINGAVVRSIPMSALRDDCSYILSERDSSVSMWGLDEKAFSSPNLSEKSSKIANELNHPVNSKNVLNNDVESRLALTGQDIVVIAEENLATVCEKGADLQIQEGSFSNNDCMGNQNPPTDELAAVSADATSPVSEEIDDNIIAENSSMLSNDGDGDSDPDDYDFRKDLELSDDKTNKDSVKLTVNPSFASLDSFYDDSYQTFLNLSSPNNNTGGLYSNFDVFSSRSNPLGINRCHSRISSGRESPNSNPMMNNGAQFDSNSNNIKNPMNSNSIQTNFNILRGNKTSHSPVATSIPNPMLIQRGLGNGVKNHSTSIPKNVSPINNRISINRDTGHGTTNLFRNSSRNNSRANSTDNTTAKAVSKKAVFTNSSDSSDNEDDNPFEFNRKSSCSKKWEDKHILKEQLLKSDSSPANQNRVHRAVFTSGGDDGSSSESGDSDSDSDVEGNINKPQSKGPTEGEILVQSDVLNTISRHLSAPVGCSKNAIYGTKINLLHYSSDSDDTFNESSDEELYMAFGSRKNVSGMTQNAVEGHENDHNGTDYENRQAQFLVDSTEVVDVPEGIFSEAEPIDLDRRSVDPITGQTAFALSKVDSGLHVLSLDD